MNSNQKLNISLNMTHFDAIRSTMTNGNKSFLTCDEEQNQATKKLITNGLRTNNMFNNKRFVNYVSTKRENNLAKVPETN